jgi:PAS domain S-box-containing protein
MDDVLATAKRAGLIFLPLAALAGVAILFLFRVQDNAARVVTEAAESRVLDQARLIVLTSLAASAADVRYLAEQPLLGEWLDTGSRLARQRVASDYLIFAAVHPAYDRVSLVDLAGKERIRVDWSAGVPRIAEDSNLEVRVEASHVAEPLKLARGQVYQSSFEIAPSDGGAAPKPIIRFATPFFDRRGDRRGVIAMSYLGQPIIDRLRAMNEGRAGRLALLNGNGNWLIGPDPASEWVAVRPGRPARSLAEDHPDLWTRIAAGDASGRFYLRGNLYTYARLAIAGPSEGDGRGKADARAVIFLSTRPAGAISAGTAELTRTRLLGAAALVCLIAAVSFIVARQWVSRRRQEQAIHRSETRFRSLLELAPDAVAITDDRGAIVLINGQAEALFGRGRDEIIGHLIDRFVPGLWQEARVPERLAKAPGEMRGARVETRGVRKDGDFPAAVTLSPVATADGTLVFCDIRDITLVKENESRIRELNDDLKLRNAELETVNRELESFSYSVSHDLRAPLRAIDGFSQALTEDAGDALDATSRSHLVRIRKATQRMGHLIDDLIRLARVMRAETSADTVDLTAMVEEIARGLKEGTPGRCANFRIESGLVATGDPQLIRVAVENLLDNAWKFTAARAETDIEFGRTEIDGAAAYFVRDNGAGFDMTYAGKLFGPFQRLHDAGQFPGTGIGLATVQRIIGKHGGRIWAEAKPEAGATFYFTLAA